MMRIDLTLALLARMQGWEDREATKHVKLRKIDAARKTERRSERMGRTDTGSVCEPGEGETSGPGEKAPAEGERSGKGYRRGRAA